MRRARAVSSASTLRSVTFLVGIGALSLGCATYSQDLARARVHYKANEFPAALAVLRLLGEDRDALSPTEQAEFAYLRGMTDLRIASTLPDTRADERASFRGCARDWLGIAVAPPAQSDGATATAPPLTPDELGRAREALADLSQIEDAPGGITPPGACIEP